MAEEHIKFLIFLLTCKFYLATIVQGLIIKPVFKYAHKIKQSRVQMHILKMKPIKDALNSMMTL